MREEKRVFLNCTMVDVTADCALRHGIDIFTEGDRIGPHRPHGRGYG